MYVITVLRAGPTSTMSSKKRTKARAVQTTASPTTASATSSETCEGMWVTA